MPEKVIYLVSTMGDDRPVPREDNPRRFIGSVALAVPAPLSTYYHRRIADGELVETEAPAAADAASSTQPVASTADAAPSIAPVIDGSSTPVASSPPKGSKAKPSTSDQGGK